MAGSDVSVGGSPNAVTTQTQDPVPPIPPATVVLTDEGPKRLSVEAIRNRQSGLTTTQLNEQLDAYSERNSTNLRSLVLGNLGLTWILLLGKDETIITASISDYTLLWIAGFCVLALCMDVLQYVFGEHAVEDAFDRAEKSDSKTARYNRKLFSYRAQLWSYRAKQVLAALATLLLLVTLGRALI